ncbi:putative metallophosphoesterase YhaO [Rosistilla carotiformis]|uniref:Putative metallophosphoesterase YhaO n=1 Tax=Rosistilla carotiformis TaxID=2528017 RepID=A0A518JXB9_9BACT|nr:metallophosphoesterase [Rosistilla carotiformis]QDV70178.1 putative metallophosphoesterase YhaO [Rosistilla carotiformis]
MVRFIHAADIHLDSPMLQLEHYEGAPAEEIRRSTRRALTNLIDLAIEKKVDFVLIAGDLYDGDWPDHNTGLFFTSEVARLRAAEIPLYFISGNHDAANKLTKALPLPTNPDGSPVQLSSTKVDSVILEDLGVAIHGRGFSKQAETSNLSDKYPRATRDLLNIGMLHTSLQGAQGHAPYAPCTPQQLADKEYDYWALGHIHIREDRAIEGSCPIVFSGNTQGRSVRETGAKGCVLVELDPIAPPKLEFQPLDVCRWEICEIDATEIDRIDDLIQQCKTRMQAICANNPDRTSIVRVRVVGQTPLYSTLQARLEHWQSVMRQETFDIDEGSIWMERLRVKATAPREAITLDASGPIGELLQTISSVSADPDAMAAIQSALEPLVAKLPIELVEDGDGVAWNHQDQIREWLDEAEPLLLNRLATLEADV